ncbi:MAG TPA: hypothetical protein VLG28_00465 [Acidimicrobiia bacterium]|jgi:hypothetical protein|nr:hypothetical protein [Acidimicrobiia bacterium]
MAHILLGRCSVQMRQMQDFTTRIQNWEQDVVGTPAAPDFHAVYLEREQPGNVVIELRFSSREVADACIDAGHVSRLQREVFECTENSPGEFTRYDLFYGASADGERTIFGETVHHHAVE